MHAIGALDFPHSLRNLAPQHSGLKLTWLIMSPVALMAALLCLVIRLRNHRACVRACVRACALPHTATQHCSQQ